MSTPAGIAVYKSSGPAPKSVGDRPWRGVYHHWDGTPGELGNLLLSQVQGAKGNLERVVRELIDDAPFGWSSISEGSKYDEAEPGFPVSPTDTGSVLYVYIFDIEKRRMDVFATHSDAHGELLQSIQFAENGVATPCAVDLDPTELLDTDPGPMDGTELSPADMESMLGALPEIKSKTCSLQWVECTEKDGAILATYRVLEYEGEELRNVAEAKAVLVPKNARRHSERVRNYLKALARVVSPRLTYLTACSLLEPNPLQRSLARSVDRFAAILESPTYFGAKLDEQ